MKDLLSMFNNLLSAWLAEHGGSGNLQVLEIKLDSQGGLVLGRLEYKDWRGDVVLRFHTEAPQGTRQIVRLTVERWPEKMPAAIEPFRRVLETARLQLELDFSPKIIL